MNNFMLVFTMLAWIGPGQKEVWAADAVGSYGGSALVGIFIGFCVLMVTVQLLPTMLLLIGTVKGFLGKAPIAKPERQIWVRER